MNKKNIKRIGIDLPLEMAIEVKTLASKKNITMRHWLLRAILLYIQEERKYDRP
jgi:metal-responsive CopG/Arc/MetJ family transcriptional regulator